jgi:hypothetical protein
LSLTVVSQSSLNRQLTTDNPETTNLSPFRHIAALQTGNGDSAGCVVMAGRDERIDGLLKQLRRF